MSQVHFSSVSQVISISSTLSVDRLRHISKYRRTPQHSVKSTFSPSSRKDRHGLIKQNAAHQKSLCRARETAGGKG